MTISFPVSLDALTNPSASDTMDSVTVPHATQHANLNDAVEALEAKVGIDSSLVVTSLDYLLRNHSASYITSGTLPVSRGGNGLATAAIGDIRYGSAVNTLAALTGNVTTTKNFLSQTGDGVNSAAPAWATLVAGDIPALTTATYIIYGDVTGKPTGDSAFLRASLAFTIDPNTDNTLTSGYGKFGLASSGTSTAFYVAQASNYNSTDYMCQQLATGTSTFNAKTTWRMATGGTTKATLLTNSFTINSGVPVTINDTTASTTAATGALIVAGGIGVAKNVTVNGTTGASLRTATVTANAAVAVTLGSTGPTGSTAGAPQGWLLISANGTDRYIPFW